MAIEKQIKTKISLRYLDYNTWSADSFKTEKPLKGEVWFCAVPANNDNATTAPTMLFKVGDGVNTFGDLKWGSALAADVYGWAKKENLDLADLPDVPVVDEGSGKFVTSVTWDQANNKIVITRDDAVNTLAATDDDIVVLTVDKTKGDVTIDAKHAEKGVVYNGGQAANSINAFGQEITIKVPKLGIDKYGHTNSAEDVEYKISLPTPEAATNTVTTVTEGDGIEVEDTATDGNHNYVVSHANTSDVANVVAADRTYVKSLTFDEFGHVTAVDVGTETDPVYDFATIIPENETPLTITDKGENEADTEDLVYAVSNLTEGGVNGHAITAEYKAVATKAYVDKTVAGAVDYLGTVDALTDLATDAGRGDFYRAAVEIKSGDTILAHAGDLLVAEKDKPAQQIDGINWSVIHGHEGRLTEVVAGEGLTGGGSIDSVTVSHDVASGATEGDHKSTAERTYITNVKTDKFGHVIGVETGTEADDGILSVSAIGDNEITLGATEENGAVTITAAHTTHAAGEAKTASTAMIADYDGTGTIKIPKIVTNAAGHVTEISEETVTITMPARQEIPEASGEAKIAEENTDGTISIYKATLGANHVLGDGEEAVKLAKVAKTGSAYDLAEANTGTDKDGNEVMYFILDCNW